jgi:hypothetical protein
MVGDVPIDSETLLMTNFVNFKIKSTQSFECAHRDSVCVHVFIGEYIYVYEYLSRISKKTKHNAYIR